MRVRAQVVVVWMVALLPRTAVAVPPDLPEHYTFALAGRFMVPPTDSPVQGSADLLWDPPTHGLAGFVLFGTLRGTLTSLQVHGPAAPGESAPLLVDLGATRHILIADMPHAMITMLKQELLYVQVNTTAYPDGEERGQITRATDAVETSTWTAVRALFR